MLKADDLVRMRATAAAIRADRTVEVTFWRQTAGGDEASFEQEVRLSFLGNRPIRRQSPQAGQITNTLLVRGAPDLDIERDDRFTLGDEDTGYVRYVIDLVRPDREIETVAEARVEG